MKVVVLALMLIGVLTTSSMALDLSQVLKGDNGKPATDVFADGATTPGKDCGDTGEKPCLTAAEAIAHALLLCIGPPYCENEKPNPEAKYKRALIAERVRSDPKNVTFTIEDAPVVKGVVGEMYAPLVVKQVWDILSPPPDKK